MFMAVLMNEPALYSEFLAKHRAAIFNMSRSSSARRSSALSLSTLLLASFSSCVNCSFLPDFTALIQLYELWAETPSRSATSLTVCPRTTAWRTA